MARREVGQRVRTGLLLAGLSFAEFACSTGSPEVVATLRVQPAVGDSGARDGPLFGDLQLIEGCSPGRYTGEFKSQRSDGGTGLVLRGRIDFVLVESPDREFLEVEPGSVLSGSDQETQSTFTSKVLSDSACKRGEFSVRLVDGRYTFAGLGPIGFTGEVSGTYFPERQSFSGEWTAYADFDPSTPSAWGRWFAYPDD